MLAIQGAYCPFIHLADNLPRGGGWAVVERVLAHYLLVVSYDGEEQIVVGKERYLIRKNEGYLIQPGVLAEHIGSTGGNRPCWVHFDVIYNPRREEHENTYSFARDLTDRVQLLQPNAMQVWGLELPVKLPAELQSLFARRTDPMIALWKQHDAYSQLQANAELYGLLSELVRHLAPASSHSGVNFTPETRIRRAEAIAHTRLAHGLTVEEFAAAAGLGRAQFTRIYTKLRGKSPGQALRDIRLAEAGRLLATTTLGVAEIAKLVGYPSSTAFGRFFAARHRMTPSQWRLAHEHHPDGDALPDEAPGGGQ